MRTLCRMFLSDIEKRGGGTPGIRYSVILTPHILKEKCVCEWVRERGGWQREWKRRGGGGTAKLSVKNLEIWESLCEWRLQKVSCWCSWVCLPVFNVDVAVQHGLPHQLGLNELEMREEGSSRSSLCSMEMFARQCFVWILLKGTFCLVSKKK